MVRRADRLDDWQRRSSDHPPPEGIGPAGLAAVPVDPAAGMAQRRCRDSYGPARGVDGVDLTSPTGSSSSSRGTRTRQARPFALSSVSTIRIRRSSSPASGEGATGPSSSLPRRVADADRLELPQVFADLKPDDVTGHPGEPITRRSRSSTTRSAGSSMRSTPRAWPRTRIVVYLGDNGYMLGQHGRFEKHCFYEPAVRVPLIFRWPGRLPEGRGSPTWSSWSTSCRPISAFRRPRAGRPPRKDLTAPARGDSGAAGSAVVFSEYN